MTTVASFTLQALGLSVLLAVPLLTVQMPPRLEWIRSSFFSPPPAPAPPAASNAQRAARASDVSGVHLLQPRTIPLGIARVNDDISVPAAPSLSEIGVPSGTGTLDRGVPGSIWNPAVSAPAPPPLRAQPLRISRMAEGDLVYRVQPSYPALARQARIQGSVRLRAIISRSGTIENLSVLSGHAMLVAVAVEAVKQWRYRPYMLNGEAIEVETEITVNFLLAEN